MARVPGTLDQRKIYAIRSFGLNEIIHFSNERYDSLGKARRVCVCVWGGNSKKKFDLL